MVSIVFIGSSLKGTDWVALKLKIFNIFNYLLGEIQYYKDGTFLPYGRCW